MVLPSRTGIIRIWNFIMAVLFILFGVSSAESNGGKNKSHEYVKIGLLTSMFTLDWSADTGTQYLGAILMAINEINSNDTLLPDTQLLVAYFDSHLDPGSALLESLKLATQQFNDSLTTTTGVDIVLGPVTSAEAESTATVLKEFDIPQISMSATSPDLSYKLGYPYFMRTCPSDAFQGKALADLVAKQYKWSRVGTFANSDSYGSAGILAFQTEAVTLGVEIVYSANFPLGMTSFGSIIEAAIQSGVKIFVFFMDGHDAAYLLSQGYDAGLFVEGTQVIGSDAVVSNVVSTMTSIVSSPEKASVILKGILGVSLYSDLTSNGSLGAAFMQRFTALPPTCGSNGACDSQEDSVGNYYWQETDTSSGQVFCGGTNYSQLALDGTNMDPFAPFAYDAMYAVAHALHIMIYQNNQTVVTGPVLFDTLINNVSFEGVTGLVSFQKSQTTTYGEDYGQGDRVTGVTYAVYNFQPELYLADAAGAAGFITVGLWDTYTGVQMCSERVVEAFGDCSLVFNTADNSPPSDQQPDLLYTLPSYMQREVLYALAGILAFITVTLSIFSTIFRRRLKIKYARVPMLATVLFGGLTAAARTAVGALLPSTASCTAKMWLSHVTFWLVFGTLTLMIWRVHRVLRASLKRLKVTTRYIMQIIVLCIGLVCLYLVLTTYVGKPLARYQIFSEARNQATKQLVCTMVYPQFEIVLFVSELILVGYAAFLCWVTRTVPDALNETRYVLAALVFFISVCIVIALVYVYVGGMTYSDKSVMVALGFAVTAIMSIYLLFVPIIFSKRMERTNLQRNLNSVRRGIVPSDSTEAKSVDVASSLRLSFVGLDQFGRMLLNAAGLRADDLAVAPDDRGSKIGDDDDDEGVMLLHTSEWFRSTNPDRRLELSNTMVNEWKKRLAQSQKEYLLRNDSGDEASNFPQRIGSGIQLQMSPRPTLTGAGADRGRINNNNPSQRDLGIDDYSNPTSSANGSKRRDSLINQSFNSTAARRPGVSLRRANSVQRGNGVSSPPPFAAGGGGGGLRNPEETRTSSPKPALAGRSVSARSITGANRSSNNNSDRNHASSPKPAVAGRSVSARSITTGARSSNNNSDRNHAAVSMRSANSQRRPPGGGNAEAK